MTRSAAVSVSVTVQAGRAETMLVTGSSGELRTKVLSDELRAPTGDEGRVRLIQGVPDVGDVDVSAVDGPVLARGVGYGEATGYASVRQGRWSLRVNSQAKGVAAERASSVDIRPGTVQSLLVLRAEDGGLELRSVVDGTGIALAPQGA